MRFLLTLLATTFFLGNAFAQKELRSQVEAGIEQLELESAFSLSQDFESEKDRTYYQTRIFFLHYLSTEDPELLPGFLDQAKGAIRSLEDLEDDDAEKNVMLAEVYLLRGVARMLDQRYVGSAFDIKSACNLIDKNQRLYPENVEQLKLLGTFEVAMSAIPRKLRWLTNALCFKGDLEQGLMHLSKAAAESRLLSSEAEVIQFYFEKNLLSEPEKAFDRVARMQKSRPQSPVYNYLVLSAHLELRQIDAAIDFCESVEEASDKEITFPLWHYARAKAHYFRLDFPQAIARFDTFLKLYKGKTLVSDALFRKGMSLVLMDQYPEARRIFHQMSNVESSTFDEDEYASHMASIYRFKEPSTADKQLYRARNLFDGGFYQRSTLALDELSLGELNENQRTEYHYRKGRNAQAIEKADLAQEAYLKCLSCKPGQALWMKVYAHFYLGQLAEAAGQVKKAEIWYEQALDFDGYEYQSGLEQRCKAAIHRIRNNVTIEP